MLLVLLPQILCKLVNGKNDHHNDDGGKTDCIVRNGDHINSPPIKLDEKTLNKVKAM